MPDTEIRTLRLEGSELTHCPAFVFGEDDLPEQCGEPLRVLMVAETRGDDYGAWVNYAVYFACGHTLDDMQAGLRHAEYI